MHATGSSETDQRNPQPGAAIKQNAMHIALVLLRLTKEILNQGLR